MFKIFKKIKHIIMKKEEIEQQLSEAIAVSQRLGTENKELRLENESLKASLAKASDEFNSAVERVRYLADQIKMYEAQDQVSTKYNDNSRNY